MSPKRLLKKVKKAPSNSKDLLPAGDGPSLRRFLLRGRPIEFLRRLDPPQDLSSTSSEGGHAHVFEVRIGTKRYAIKVFRFYSISELRSDIYPYINRRVDDSTMITQSDPFYAECRAYGRIQELELKQPRDRKVELAVPCYGYLLLPTADYEDFFRTTYDLVDWNRGETDRAKPIEQRAPFRAIVKELIQHQKAVVRPKVMLSSLRKLRNGGVYQRDIYARNYLGGKLIDFSIAWTTPHWAFKMLSPRTLEIHRDIELADFDNMMVAEGVRKPPRASRVYRELRSLPGKESFFRSAFGQDSEPSDKESEPSDEFV